MPFSFSFGLSGVIHIIVILISSVIKPFRRLFVNRKICVSRWSPYWGIFTSLVIAFIILSGAWEIILLSISEQHSSINFLVSHPLHFTNFTNFTNDSIKIAQLKNY